MQWAQQKHRAKDGRNLIGHLFDGCLADVAQVLPGTRVTCHNYRAKW